MQLPLHLSFLQMAVEGEETCPLGNTVAMLRYTINVKRCSEWIWYSCVSSFFSYSFFACDPSSSIPNSLRALATTSTTSKSGISLLPCGVGVTSNGRRTYDAQ
ncbi:hypothetical protein EV361DRAFT_188799 [Lentinula raphanica]|nr:hypothetical protein EV361DRAFT_188799 [Lentinula raphanica]